MKDAIPRHNLPRHHGSGRWIVAACIGMAIAASIPTPNMARGGTLKMGIFFAAAFAAKCVLDFWLDRRAR